MSIYTFNFKILVNFSQVTEYWKTQKTLNIKVILLKLKKVDIMYAV